MGGVSILEETEKKKKEVRQQIFSPSDVYPPPPTSTDPVTTSLKPVLGRRCVAQSLCLLHFRSEGHWFESHGQHSDFAAGSLCSPLTMSTEIIYAFRFIPQISQSAEGSTGDARAAHGTAVIKRHVYDEH